MNMYSVRCLIIRPGKVTGSNFSTMTLRPAATQA
jgi:hypothetical protein